MTKPTREQIQAAHYATEQLALLATSITERHDVKDYREMILKALPPKPQPTMAEVKWDDKKHYLAEAEHVDWGKVVMLYYDGQFNRIQYFCKLDESNMVVYSDPANLTPTGKRYTLTEVQDG